MKIDLIAGARPNFMKIAPLISAIEKTEQGLISYRLIHTGQHYDYSMSGSFFHELGIPTPHVTLEAGGGSQAVQTGLIMQRYEDLLLKETTNLCLVVGDVTSTMACAITAKKLNIPVAHVEAGIRSGDRTMPEEINRLVTDSIADIFFTTTREASETLIQEGHLESQIHLVGNTMIDTLLKQLTSLKEPKFFSRLNLLVNNYFVLTLHRPSNVDNPEQLYRLLGKIQEGAGDIPIIFPAHPRTKAVIERCGVPIEGLNIVQPMSYLEFNYLVKSSMGVITDSGGITEETTVMNVPCLTLRNTTERPETCSIGTNVLVGSNPDMIPQYLDLIRAGKWKKGGIPDFWDGKTAERIIEQLLKFKGEI